MWRHHFLKLQITNPSAVLVSSDVRTSNYLTFCNVSARQVFSICSRGRLNFCVIELRDCKWQHERALALVKRGVIAHVLANWTVLTTEEVLLIMCRHSRGISFGFNGKTHWQMFLLFYYHHEGHQHGVSIQSSINFGETLFQITREWKPHRTKSRQGVLCIIHLSHPRFLA